MTVQYQLRPGRMRDTYDAMPELEWISGGDLGRLIGDNDWSTTRIWSTLNALCARGLVLRREQTPGQRDWLYLKRPESEAIQLPTEPPILGPLPPLPTTQQGAQELEAISTFERYEPNPRSLKRVSVQNQRPWLNGAPVGHSLDEIDTHQVEGSRRTVTASEIPHGTARCYMVNDCRRAECVQAYESAIKALGVHLGGD